MLAPLLGAPPLLQNVVTLLYLFLLPIPLSSLLFDTIKNGGNLFQFMKLEESMVGKYSKMTGMCSELAGTSFTIGKILF
jgi:hypothetical protein